MQIRFAFAVRDAPTALISARNVPKLAPSVQRRSFVWTAAFAVIVSVKRISVPHAVCAMTVWIWSAFAAAVARTVPKFVPTAAKNALTAPRMNCVRNVVSAWTAQTPTDSASTAVSAPIAELFARAAKAAKTARISVLNVRKSAQTAVIHSALPAIVVFIVRMNFCVKTVFCAVTVPISAKTAVSSAMTARKASVLTAVNVLTVWTNIVPTAVSVLTVPMRCVRTAIIAVTVL